MAENLPLIPEKGSECTDVRTVLRTVFREVDYLPPLILEENADPKDTQTTNATLPTVHKWEPTYHAECKDIYDREEKLKQEHAKRVAREPLPNIYKLRSPVKEEQALWKLKHNLLKRSDLAPNIADNPIGEKCLWMKNTLNASSGAISLTVEGKRSPKTPHTKLIFDYESLESQSIGAHHKTNRLGPLLPIPSKIISPRLKHAICVPAHLEFVNCRVGTVNYQILRVRNLSKYDIRLSIKLPSRAELRVSLGEYGLRVSSGAEAEIRVTFVPLDVRALSDKLVIRVSLGGHFEVPIECYMKAPILNILVPSVQSTSSFLSLLTDYATPEAEEEVIDLGTRLLGDVHDTTLLLRSYSPHASFFMLTEDAWFDYNLDCITSSGELVSGPFVFSPAWWRGGGEVRGAARCRGGAGLHAGRVLILCSNAVARSINVLADVLYFSPKHVTIEAHEKDYDIMSEDDPDCEYYVHLNSAFPNRELSTTINIFNHSPIVYSYYWSVRPWGSCCCWEEFQYEELGEEESELCVGAKETRELAKQGPAYYEDKNRIARRLRAEPAQGELPARSTLAVTVRVPDVGDKLGVQRAVLVLILRNIPKESFPEGYQPSIVRTDVVLDDTMPGEKCVRSVCAVVCAQLEVWWDVVPLRFLLEPPVLPLSYSRRLDSIDIQLRATQLFGREGVLVSWNASRVQLPTQQLIPGQPCSVNMKLTLPILTDSCPVEDIITLEAANQEWQSTCVIKRRCATRDLRISAPRVWLGLVCPEQPVLNHFEISNQTYQRVSWKCDGYRWCGENPPLPACSAQPCKSCLQLDCTCDMLSQTRGMLEHGEKEEIRYAVNAPRCDGPVATLIRARRDDYAAHSRPCDGRASLVMYRVLAPQVVLRVLRCKEHEECSKLDLGALNSALGTSVLRPSAALCVGARLCARVMLRNITALPTVVQFDRCHDNSDSLKVEFSTTKIPLDRHSEAEIHVVLEALAVCDRKLYIYRAIVEHAYQPVYLVVDLAVSGLKAACQVPLGAPEMTDKFVVIKRTQREKFPKNGQKKQKFTPEEMFLEQDRKNGALIDPICKCKFTMEYIPPKRQLNPDGKTYSPEILVDPLPLTRVCPCNICGRPVLAELEESVCLQYTKVPLRTVRTRILKLYNESAVEGQWRAYVRRWPRVPIRNLGADRHAREVSDPGVMLWWERAAGVLPARATCDLQLHVYSDCWGLYHDQVMINIKDLEPIVLAIVLPIVLASLTHI